MISGMLARSDFEQGSAIHDDPVLNLVVLVLGEDAASN
jgi:hypothetical protein